MTLRRREIGIRIALGSEPRRIFALILREGLALVGVGFAIGLAGPVAIRGVMQAQLYGIDALDSQPASHNEVPLTATRTRAFMAPIVWT